MKNKNLHMDRIKLIEQLLKEVNSETEFSYLQAEKNQLNYSQIYIDERRYMF